MTDIPMPIESATITVTGEGASGTPVKVFDGKGLVPGTEASFVVPPKGTFSMEIVTTDQYAYATQALGGGCPEWITLTDNSSGDTVKSIVVGGTAPQEFEGGVTFTVTARKAGADDETFVFPDLETTVPITVREGPAPDPSEGLTFYDGGVCGGGFGNLRRLVMTADVLSYSAGGIPVPAGFVPVSLAVSAKGGIKGWYDPSAKAVVLYKGESEASGLIEGLSIILIGRS